MNAEGRPSQSAPQPNPSDEITVRPASDRNPFRRRGVAAGRLPAYRDGGGFAARDPFALDRECEPSSFGLTREELEAEIGRCLAAGWAPWELRERFLDPKRLAA